MKMIPFSMFLIAVFIAGCSLQAMTKPSEFPLEKGTTWVYSYAAYHHADDPNQILEATYQLTETVVETETVSPHFIARVKREYKLIRADAGWVMDFSSQPNEFWYLVNGHQVLESNLPLDRANIKIDELILDYDFPLSVTKSWCLTTPEDSVKPINCEFVGRREVTSQSPFETSVGKFDDCYSLIDYWNTGNSFQKFCNGVGLVSVKFDHAGTRFGFEQTLIDYSRGSP